MKRFLPAIALACIAVLGFIAHHLAVPLVIERSYERLEPVGQDLLRGDFEPGNLLKINKDALRDFDIKVWLPDGRDLPRFPSLGALRSAEGEPGFAVARPDVFLRLPADLQDAPPAAVKAVLPIKLKQTVYEVSAVLALLSLILAGRGRKILAGLKNTAARKHALAGLLCATLVPALLAIMIGVAQGAFVWLALLAAFLLVWAFFSLAGRALDLGFGQAARSFLQSAGMVIASVLFALVIAEALLGFAGHTREAAGPSKPAGGHVWFQLPDEIVQAARVRKHYSLMPVTWKRRLVEIQDTERAYYWHGVLHYEDAMGFRRRNGPFPEKGDVYRIMIVGDSLTYGGGVAEEWTYSHLLQRALSESHRAEVINLGRPGFQSEDILGVVQGFAPELRPDLIVYGANVNDYLPSGQGGYVSYQFPLPERWKLFFNQRTRVAALLGRGYGTLLAVAGLRHDFYDDIIDAESPFRAAFARNLQRMNDVVREQGLPPIVGLVLTPPKSTNDPRSQVIADLATSAMKQAGFDLVSVLDRGTRLSPDDLAVSAWDGHPNELAHSLIAESLYERIRLRGDLAPFRHRSGSLQRQSKAFWH